MDGDMIGMAEVPQVEPQDSPTYWATYEPERLLAEIDDRVQAYYDHIDSSGMFDLWQKMHEQMHRGRNTGGHIGITGEDGQLTRLDVNDIANLEQHSTNLTTSQRLEFEAMATNSDHASQSQTILADAVVDYAMRALGLDRKMIKACRNMFRYGEGAIWIDWDTDAGDDVRPDETDNVVKSGDARFQALHPVDVIRDPDLGEFDDGSWVAVRVWRNRYDLEAKYPEVAGDIDKVPGRREESSGKRKRLSDSNMRDTSSGPESDEVPVYYWYHKRSSALPQGRMVVYMEPDVLLFDGPLPFKRIPVIRVSAADIDDEPFGYTPFFDLLAIQTGIDSVISTVTSNQATFGVQNLWTQTGCNLEVKRLGQGMNHFSGGTVPPQPLQLVASSPETFKLFELLESAMERISGINSTVRGNPEASLKSGAALALVYAQTVQFIGLAQRAYHLAAEQVADMVVECYQELSQVERTIAIAGEQSRTYAVTLQKGGLSAIDRVSVRVANPLSGTIAGRYNLAEMMLQNGMIKEPDQLMMVMTTGRLDNVTESPVRERMNIRAENERLSKGEVPAATFLDHHLRHIQEHATVLASPESRETIEVVQACQAHIQEHLNLWRTTDPDILAALGIPPPPSAMMPPPGVPAAPGGPPPGGPEVSGAVPEPQGGDTNPIAASGVNMPRAPKNPATGEAPVLPGVNA
jgi:hypothetical protein